MSNDRKDAIARFIAAKIECAKLMRAAANDALLPDLFKAHATAITALADQSFHRIIGEPDAADLLRLREDVEAVAEVIDPLVLAIGTEASESIHGIDLDCFADQLSGALTTTAADSNAIAQLENAAERITEHHMEAAE